MGVTGGLIPAGVSALCNVPLLGCALGKGDVPCPAAAPHTPPVQLGAWCTSGFRGKPVPRGAISHPASVHALGKDAALGLEGLQHCPISAVMW